MDLKRGNKDNLNNIHTHISRKVNCLHLSLAIFLVRSANNSCYLGRGNLCVVARDLPFQTYAVHRGCFCFSSQFSPAIYTLSICDKV